MRSRLYILLLFVFAATTAFCQKPDVTFDVIFNDEKVGTLHAGQTSSGSTSTKFLNIETSTTFMFIPVHMESEVSATYEKGVLIKSTAYRDASRRSSDVIASVTKIGPRRYSLDRNGVKGQIRKRIDFCVIDLYFKEPLRIKQVFSNMHTRMLPVKRIGNGKYQLTAPDNNTSIYNYRDGKLISIEVETAIGKVVSKRNSE